ncbi:uncharacterized protein UV8b_02269 [Ustilaginoidea virens]|uniref:Uncharacterized protein n=1 Tax=Ustilaginoidea virens TaxID=1159556 RepID=A0A8E5HMI9_USTVR|nr:uncharacterized protein UV8b_02269 [Ustilaginoidea virens]QUC18028.1 hypothetical protein UV8b_02269 [Ustilaginoidea virens]
MTPACAAGRVCGFAAHRHACLRSNACAEAEFRKRASKQQAASSKQQAASSKQQAASSKQQAASSKQQAASSKQQAASKQASKQASGETPRDLTAA